MAGYTYIHTGILREIVRNTNYTRKVNIREAERSWVTDKGTSYDKVTGRNGLRGHNLYLDIKSIKLI